MTMFVNRLQRNRVRLLSLALLLAAAGALVWVAVTALNDESAPSTPLVADNVLGNAPDAPVVGGQGGSGSVPLALTDVMDGLVRTGDAVSLAEGIYTGGSLLGAVYFSFESVADVITLYEETMAAENWRLVSLSGSGTHGAERQSRFADIHEGSVHEGLYNGLDYSGHGCGQGSR